MIACTDACGQRQLYYGTWSGRIVLTSSLRLFVEELAGESVISNLKFEFMRLQEFGRNEQGWYSDESMDDRLWKVLPNHYLDINKTEVRRIPIFQHYLIRGQDMVEYSAKILQGGIRAILRRYDVVQPLTAGWDTRTLLAAARFFTEAIQFYVFDLTNRGGSRADVAIPQVLSDKLNLNLAVIRLQPPRMDFMELYKAEHINARLSKVEDNQYLYDHYRDRHVVRVSGIASAIVKSFYGFTDRKITENMLRYFSGYPADNRFLIKGIKGWFKEAEEYCEEYGMRILDLFHWEQKEGNWGALCAFEQDIAVEEFWPHANRNFLVSALQMHPSNRCSPKCKLYRNLIAYMWREALSEPINPSGKVKKAVKRFKRNAILRYGVIKMKSAARKMLFSTVSKRD
jgi:hypothetical protein